MMKKFISKTELAEYLGISLSSVNRGMKKNLWPFSNYIRLGTRILYPARILSDMEEQSMKINEGALCR